MRLLIIVSLLLCLPCAIIAQRRRPQSQPQPKTPPKEQKIFPYQYTIDELPNGLHLITIPTDFPNLVAVYTVVRTGSRNEVEPGKSGYAHLFEHLMFRGSEHYTPEQRDAILKRAGAEDNAYTTDDRTVFHEVDRILTPGGRFVPTPGGVGAIVTDALMESAPRPTGSSESGWSCARSPPARQHCRA